jgi:tetratricopeptide (TPR) repeat protein
VFGSLGRLGEAREHHERYLALSREVGNRRHEAHAAESLGVVAAALGDSALARAQHEQFLAISREVGNRGGEGAALRCLASVSAEDGDAAAAERLYAEALALQRQIGHPVDEAETLVAAGAHLARQGRDAEARAHLDAALALALELSLPHIELLATAQLAVLSVGDVAAALAALTAHEGRCELQEVMEARSLLWRATLDPVHIAEARRLLDLLVEHAPPECRESMIANVRLHREIAAAVVGGCSLRGGEGSVLGIVLGTALLQVLRNLVNLLDIPSSLDFAVMGAVILVGVAADEIIGRRVRNPNG